MRYEEPNMRVLVLEAEDIITLSNDGPSTDGNEGETPTPDGEWQ